MMNEPQKVTKIMIEYGDGSVKTVERGVCFSVAENGEYVSVRCDGVAGDDEDELAVIAVIANIAKDMGISNDLCRKIGEAENARKID